jgi:hypothetical protein
MAKKEQQRDADGRLTHYRDSGGILQPVHYPKGRTVLVVDAVTLIRQRANRYAVVYGLQVRSELGLDGATNELGSCLMHQLECEGVLSV